MKVKFLLQHIGLEGTRAIACLSAGIFSLGYATKSDATEGIKTLINNLLETEGKEFIQGWMGNSEVINCPDGYIKLPIDMWCCKLTGARCNLQAQVFLQDHALFLSRCTAPDDKKAGILKAATEGKYKGFHHIPGRNLCPTCECNSPFNHHYRFELTFVYRLLGISDEDERDRFRLKTLHLGVSSEAIACALCPPCAFRIASIIDNGISNDLEIIEIDFFPR